MMYKMIDREFNEIQWALKTWMLERNLEVLGQQHGLLGNLLEELTEFERARSNEAKIDALCDIAVFILNANIDDFKYQNVARVFDEYYKDFDNNNNCFIICMLENLKGFNPYAPMNEYLAMIFAFIHKMGYNPYCCMLETIRELDSRTGEYCHKTKKFIKDIGAYTKAEAYIKANKIKPFNIECCDYVENEDYFIFTPKDSPSIKIKKWYKADYEICKY